jgi:hypothetical protein
MLHMRRFPDGKSKTGTGCALGDTDGCPGAVRERLRAQGPLRAGRVRALARTAHRTVTQSVGPRGHARPGGGATAVQPLRTARRAPGSALSGSDRRWTVAVYRSRGGDLLRGCAQQFLARQTGPRGRAVVAGIVCSWDDDERSRATARSSSAIGRTSVSMRQTAYFRV